MKINYKYFLDLDFSRNLLTFAPYSGNLETTNNHQKSQLWVH